MILQGTLRVLLVLLHDFPEFLCEYHFELCNMIPPSCIQMRNLILSAFPRNMRLPDPFTPNLKVLGAPTERLYLIGPPLQGGTMHPPHAMMHQNHVNAILQPVMRS